MNQLRNGWTLQRIEELCQRIPATPQGCRNSAGNCKMRNERGEACAIGVFMPDDVAASADSGEDVVSWWKANEDTLPLTYTELVRGPILLIGAHDNSDNGFNADALGMSFEDYAANARARVIAWWRTFTYDPEPTTVTA